MFKGRLALNPRLNLTRVSFSVVQKHFLGQFSLLFLRASNHQLVDKRIKLKLFFKLSNLNSNFALTLGYLNPALNNPAQDNNVQNPLRLFNEVIREPYPFPKLTLTLPSHEGQNDGLGEG